MTTTINMTNTSTIVTHAAIKDIEMSTDDNSNKIYTPTSTIADPSAYQYHGVKLGPIMAPEREDVKSKS
jgi:hypothetical protein